MTVEPGDGDDGPRIQAAIDYVASLPLDASGLRGAVLLLPGEHHVKGTLRLSADGVVLRGAGAGPGGTTLLATGSGRRPLISLGAPPGAATSHVEGRSEVAGPYSPVGATTLRLAEGHGFSTGDLVRVTRPSTEAWIIALGARVDGVGWRAGRADIRWERRVVSADSNSVTLDAPLTTSLDADYGGGTIERLTVEGRVSRVGVQDLTLRSAYHAENPRDEEHAWHGVVAQDVADAWVARVRFQHFAGGAVLVREGALRVTVVDCLALAPVSELAAYRRQAFFTQGQQTLFLRCWSERGGADFATGHCAPGPNAFVNCVAHRTRGDSGPLESWASGVLFDNVRIDGGDLALQNRWLDPPGAGWAAANCMAWQCQAAQLKVFSPPTAQNWAIGYWAQPVGDGVFSGLSDFVRPLSLYQAQTRERLGGEAAERIGPFLLDPEESTSPTRDEAARFVAQSNAPGRTLRDLIEQRILEAPAPNDAGAPQASGVAPPKPRTPAAGHSPLGVENGWLAIDGSVVTGGTLSPTWWRGAIRPDDAPEFGPAITRFAAGRDGPGLTDDLERVAATMRASNTRVYDHHYGLWYDRRRDDHLMVRRADGAVAPPYFEQPFARTGRGRAWDGLSRYDLTRFNPWYWGRLAEFAGLCDSRGMVFIHQHYFQHNILEAGAHWADCPWRPANNVNQTGFPEPPPYVGDKRLFMAHHFYSLDNPSLVALHRGYIRQCLEGLKDASNVVHMTGDEFTGPTEFVAFWLRTIGEWERETGRDALVGLSCTRDVQDAILSDARLARLVDVVDIRYWCYQRTGEPYAPPGGANMAPRQHLRQLPAKPADAASIARAVAECRSRYPGKGVTYFADRFCASPAGGWASLLAGGSLANVPPLPEELEADLTQMTPEASLGGAPGLSAPGRAYLLTGATVEADLPAATGGFRLVWIDPETGATAPDGIVPGGGTFRRPSDGRLAWLRRVD